MQCRKEIIRHLQVKKYCCHFSIDISSSVKNTSKSCADPPLGVTYRMASTSPHTIIQVLDIDYNYLIVPSLIVTICKTFKRLNVIAQKSIHILYTELVEKCFCTTIIIIWNIRDRNCPTVKLSVKNLIIHG